MAEVNEKKSAGRDVICQPTLAERSGAGVTLAKQVAFSVASPSERL